MNFFEKATKKLKTKYKMKFIATIVSMPGGIVKELGLDFQIVGPLSKERIRKILIDCVQDFLCIINQNENIQPILEIYPYKISNVEITLFIVDPSGRNLDDPNIGIAAIKKGDSPYAEIVELK